MGFWEIGRCVYHPAPLRKGLGMSAQVKKRPVGRPKAVMPLSRSLQVALEPALYDAIRRSAKTHGKRVSAVVRELLQKTFR